MSQFSNPRPPSALQKRTHPRSQDTWSLVGRANTPGKGRCVPWFHVGKRLTFRPPQTKSTGGPFHAWEPTKPHLAREAILSGGPWGPGQSRLARQAGSSRVWTLETSRHLSKMLWKIINRTAQRNQRHERDTHEKGGISRAFKKKNKKKCVTRTSKLVVGSESIWILFPGAPCQEASWAVLFTLPGYIWCCWCETRDKRMGIEWKN